MLVELRIRDYAVVDDLAVKLGPGLNALTGETGAGKSIIVGALSLLLGDRASSDVVRVGADRATVEAVFDVDRLPAVKRLIDEHGFRLEDGLLILRREVAAEGRNRAWVCGSAATAGVVGAIGSALVDLHGQHEHQTLLRPADQRAILDAFGGAQELAASVRDGYGNLRALRDDLDEREQRRREVESRADFLRFQLAEIEEASPAPGEDETLSGEASRHEHAEELARGAAEAYARLYEGEGSAMEQLAAARAAVERIAAFDPTIAGALEQLVEIAHAVDDLGARLGDYASAVEHDPARLEEVRERLDRIVRLKRKYGPELADVLENAQRIRTELEELEDAEHGISRIRAQIDQAESELKRIAVELSASRGRAATDLQQRLEALLPALGLEGAHFEVRLTPYDAVAAGGAEGVEFRVAPNQGFAPMPLSKIASGGELSRVMLALKSILATVDRVPVLIFDEIDAGIGGAIATAVAEQLEEVSARHQVFVVTHLPQVASRARAHFVVSKSRPDDGGATRTEVSLLDDEGRVEEVARMLGGDPESRASRDHARELLNR